jgi:hypothetical protein
MHSARPSPTHMPVSTEPPSCMVVTTEANARGEEMREPGSLMRLVEGHADRKGTASILERNALSCWGGESRMKLGGWAFTVIPLAKGLTIIRRERDCVGIQKLQGKEPSNGK